jgi:5-formyltetrahydrofolate cyclo-ligase
MNTQRNAENTAVELRARLRQARAELTSDQRSQGSLLMRARLFTWLNVAREQAKGACLPKPSRIAAFWPMADELDLLPLLSQWADADDITLCLPVVVEPNAPLEFRPWTPDTPMRVGPYGIKEPESGQALLPDVLLVPTLGYTWQGDRLGYGGGYYNRTLASLSAQGHTFTTIGVAWDCGLLDADYQAAPHDMPLDAIITPDGWIPDAPLNTHTSSGRPLKPHTYILR